MALVQPDPDELRWVRPEKLDAPMTAAPRGNPPLLVVTRRNQCISIHKFTQMFRVVRVPWLQGWDSGGQLCINTPYILYVHVCVSQSERDRLRDGGCVVKRELSALTAPVPRQNARRGLFQVTNRNQTHGVWGVRLSLHSSRGSHWRSDGGEEEVGRVSQVGEKRKEPGR